MSFTFRLSAGSLPLLCGLIATTSASPLPITNQYIKRTITTGAQAGLGIGIAVAAIIVILVAVFFALHFRRRARNAALNRERAVLAGEKNPDGTDKVDKFAPEPEVTPMPRRNKSVRDRLMGPLYRESMALPNMPRAKIAAGSKRHSGVTIGDNDSFLNKPWAGADSSPRPSFSSKRATRMMMMM